MKIRNVNFPPFILKFCEKKEYRDNLLNGEIYLKESGYFRKLEDGYRGDKNDGKKPINPVKAGITISVPNTNIITTPEQIYSFQAGFDGDDKIPVFCASILNDDIMVKTKNETFKFKQEFLEQLSQFGQYIAFIKFDEFMDKIEKSLSGKEIYPLSARVKYVDILSEYNHEPLKINNPIDMYKPFFTKDKSYQWQNEWRLVLDNLGLGCLIDDKLDSYTLSVGKLDKAISLHIDTIIKRELCISRTDETTSIYFE